ncbi:MAG: serine/threonine-protein kinase [Planctomycetota bacterium]
MSESSIGGFKIVATVGFGANSVIYKVLDPLAGRELAIKSVKRESSADDKYIHQVLNEYEHASSFDHPNIVRIFGLIKHRRLFHLRRCLLLMEYVDGRPLSHMDGLGIGVLVGIFAQTAEALRYIHQMGLVHADTKPNNIMVRKDGVVKLIDFGLVGFAGKRRERVQGTMDYAAPEQLNHKTCDFKTDVYNLGATMYRVITGHHVPSRALVHRKVRFEKFRLLPPSHLVRGVPKTLDNLVLRSCAMDRDARPESMDEVLAGLAAVSESLASQRKEAPAGRRR